MIGAADKILPMADNNTKLIPEHGPRGNKADLTKFRNMLDVSRDRVQALKPTANLAPKSLRANPWLTSTPSGVTAC
jgi:hypothetical protein